MNKTCILKPSIRKILAETLALKREVLNQCRFHAVISLRLTYFAGGLILLSANENDHCSCPNLCTSLCH
jgi:hypothetical protein